MCNSEAKQVIQVFDISGKIRFSQQLWTGGSNSLNIDVSEWKQGLYFVNIEKSDGNNTSTFFIKE
ncbi:MAG: T9SS type A sorting domain-containing protein [Bacteroidetes bacterium]|nr:T9SS type A sorting domain-containing protein [Bacteroidota bacterium]